jgi:MFS family permease
LPAEHVGGAIEAGLRYARHSPALRATLIRAAAFFVFASTYWALLPLVARAQIASGPQLYGILLGAIGAGAVGGAFAMPWLRARLGPNLLVTSGMVGTAVTLALYGIAHDAITALVASVLAGVSWIAVLATLAISAQVSLPDWVRARGLALYTTVFFGCLTIGSAVWGKVAGILGLPAAHFIAAAGVLVAIPLTWIWKLQTGAGVDLTPSMHWPAPLTAQPIEQDRGPILVTVEYHIRPQDRPEFLQVLVELGRERRRDGAYRWGVFENAAEEGRIVETFLVASWMEHLRQHERVTNADRLVQECVVRFHMGDEPKVTHFIAANP